ncbi:MAG: hypothetical protein ACI4BB_07185 [Coprococcus sp.]
MKIKLCPLCDSEMKKAHYCDCCHSFIWRPEIVDIHYNAESRNLREEDCAYGSSHDQYDHGDSVSGRKDLKRQRQRTKYNDGKTKSKNWLSKAIVIIVGLNILGGLAGGVIDFVEEYIDDYKWNERIPEYLSQEIPIGGTIETEPAVEAGDYVEISDEELADYPEGCNGYEHFELTQNKLAAELHDWIGGYYGENREATYYEPGDNYKFVSEENETYIYLQKYFCFDLPTEAYGYIQVNWDSVTEQIHSVEASFGASEKEDAVQLLAQLIELLGEETDQAMAEEESREFFDNTSEGNFSMISHDMYVFVYTSAADGTIWMEVSPFD